MSDEPSRPTVSDDEVVGLAREAIESAREETRRVDEEETPKDLQKPGITIDLGHKGISRLPEETCSVAQPFVRAPYQAVRMSSSAVLQLFSLEILDVSKNRIKVLPDEIANLTSLKVLAIQRNKIEKLPLCLGEIGSLQVLKLDGNPITFPPHDICTIKKDAPAPSNENEKDAVITTQVKRYLRQIATRERLRIESEGDSSESTVDTPRPAKRMMSGRFPVKPSISGLDVFDALSKPESPGMPPYHIVRSHYRGQSQQSTNGRRPIISPLATSNERNRSSSEGANSATIRAKRGGLIIKNVSELGNVDEVRKQTADHSRTSSQSSAMSLSGSTLPGSAVLSANSSFSSMDGASQRTITHRPLSDLLEHKRRSRAPDVVVEASKTVLYAISQLHAPVVQITRNLKFSRADNGLERQMHLNRRLKDADGRIRELGAHLQQFDTLAEEDDDDATNLSAKIRTYLIDSIQKYMLLFVSIYDSAKEIYQSSDPRLLRTVMLLIQGSTAEIRNACSVLGANLESMMQPPIRYSNQTVTSKRGSSSNVASMERDIPRRRTNNGSYDAYPTSTLQPGSVHGYNHSRTNTRSIDRGVTPRSGESFAALSTRNTAYQNDHEANEETSFEKIFLKLKTATERITRILPNYRHLFHKHRIASESEMIPPVAKIRVLAELVQKSDDILSVTDMLNRRMSAIKLRDVLARNQPDFWQQATGFCKMWGDFATLVVENAHVATIPDLRRTLKPIHKAVKDVSMEINASPWSRMTPQTAQLLPAPEISINNNTMGSSASSHLTAPISRPGTSVSLASNGTSRFMPAPNPINTTIATNHAPVHHNGLQTGTVTPVPATPLSAALGAAVQATVPNGAQALGMSAPNNSASIIPTLPMQAGFPGTSLVFERADRLLSNTQRRV
ncbi:hypothetical protein EJ05DRAFT_526363 [Pseudovirgaria hyperparasitica]|uniref:Cell morphogenesis protein-like protein Sog2 n=1 Tax=Pseudovirgaria hyperparasitica TaxID=470096 RepID=A0A6A6W9W6_9PEZI|nr:uncharacterized protein EJ05DRAFT_526363 [Pseudovirgaria hyperparasitica]KAF2759642.1 hypothetical protein EJ05DRAFT_526363 [Pseudovirgaria hyperparasitica]